MLIKTLKNAGLVVLYFVTVGSLFEVFARLDDLITYNAPFFKVYTADTMLEEHDEFGRKGKANGRYEKWILNSHGFRGPEISVEKPKGTIRIVTFGASETLGLYESPGMEWPNQLRNALNKLYPHKKIEVINTGLAGQSLETSKDYFRNRVLKFSPDIVLYYQGFVSYLSKSFVDQRLQSDALQKGRANINQIVQRRPNLSDIADQLRIFPKLKQAFKEKGPRALVAWITNKKIQRMYNSIDKEEQIKTIDRIQVEYYKKKLTDFVLFMKENNITVVLAEHDNKIITGPDSENVGPLVVLWKYYPSISSEVFREGYPIFNSVIRQVAEETNSFFAEQKSLLTNPEKNFAEDGVHLTDIGAERLMGNFLKATEKILEVQYHIKPAKLAL